MIYFKFITVIYFLLIYFNFKLQILNASHFQGGVISVNPKSFNGTSVMMTAVVRIG